MTFETGFSADDWSSLLSQALGRPVEVRYGRARRQVIVARQERDATRVRMNALFADAPREVREATCAWLRSGKRARGACARLDSWIASMDTSFAAAARCSGERRTRGEEHDLRELTDGLLADEFARTSFSLGEPPEITWGRRRRGARRTLHLGSFDPGTNLARVHPVLDQSPVPGFFVRYILFHELLHAVLPTVRPRVGRAVHHGPEFRRLERRYRDYRRAVSWQDANLPALLRSARTGEPMARPRGLRAALRRGQGLLFPGLVGQGD